MNKILRGLLVAALSVVFAAGVYMFTFTVLLRMPLETYDAVLGYFLFFSGAMVFLAYIYNDRW